MKKLTAIIFLTLFGLTLFSLTLRGTVGNPETSQQLGALNIETGPFESSHERAPYAEMLAIKNRGTIELGKNLADFASPDVGYRNNTYYSFFPSGVSYVMLGFYKLGQPFNLGQLAAYFTSSIMTILSMVLIYLIAFNAFKLSHWASILASATYAFATTSWSYSITVFQHSYAVFFMLSMFYAAWRYKQSRDQIRSILWISLFWILYATAIFFDYPNLLIFAPLPVYAFLSSFSFKKISHTVKARFNIGIIIGFLFFIGIMYFHGQRNAAFFGNWKTYGNSLPRYTVNTKNDNAAADAKSKPQKRDYGSIFLEERIPRSASTLLVGIDKGLFIFSPILILALFGIYSIRKHITAEYAILLGLITSNLFVYVSFPDPWGGWAYGPRYLIPLMSLMPILIATWVSQSKFGLVRKIVFFILFIPSSAIALAGPLTTNLIPPKVEADYLKLDFYNFMRAFDLVEKGKSGVFIFNEYVRDFISLQQYFLIIWVTLLVIALLLLFIVPVFEHDHES